MLDPGVVPALVVSIADDLADLAGDVLLDRFALGSVAPFDGRRGDRRP
ncbi:MAG: hypothetical protein R2710_14115 [Acidimicrobiales bacterium]